MMMKKSLAVVLALLLELSGLANAEDLSEPIILVAKREVRDTFFGSSILVVAPLGGDEHVGFIVNRPTSTRLGAVFPEHGPSHRQTDPVYLGGPTATEVIFALVERADSPGGQSLAVMPGLYVAFDATVVDRIFDSQSDHARFVAGLVAWRPGELRAEIDAGAWYVLAPDAALVMRKPEGLWEDLVRRSQQVDETI